VHVLSVWQRVTANAAPYIANLFLKEEGACSIVLIFAYSIFAFASASIAQHRSDPYPNSTGQPGE
jgi:hypothetical protein